MRPEKNDSALFKVPWIKRISEDCYDKGELVLEKIQAFSLFVREPIYVIDLFRGKIAFASASLCSLWGVNLTDVITNGEEFFKQIVSEKDMPLVKEVRDSVVALFSQNSEFFGTQYRLDYDFHLKIGKTEKLFHQRTVSLLRTEEGKDWLILNSLFPSHAKKAGNVTIQKMGEKDFLCYDFLQHDWKKDTMVRLTDNEKQIITLSTYGFSGKEIADIMFRSYNTIKTYKRHLLHKLNATDIKEVIAYCNNHEML